MKVNASSAIGTVTVAADVLESDPLLRLVLTGAVSPLQLTVVITPAASKKGANVLPPPQPPLRLVLLSGATLTQRNAIVRCLCGMGMHNAADGVPRCLLGGHASPAATASAGHAVALASLSGWMSAADRARRAPEDDVVMLRGILAMADSHLETRAFLVPGPSMTVADVDLAAALADRVDVCDAVASHPHVHRWMWTVQEVLRNDYGIGLVGDGATSAPVVPPLPHSRGPPMFFYGNETNVCMPKPLVAKRAASAAAGGDDPAGSKPKQALADQPQQKGGEKKEKGNAKAAKQPKEAQEAVAAATPVDVDVSALDIRVGRITKAWHHPESDKLFCEEIDVGEDQPRQIASGLRAFYETPDLEGRRVIVLCNLKKRNLVGFPSHGMVLCASNSDHTAVEFMEPPVDAKIGERVTFGGYDGSPEPENKIAKKKIFEALSPDLKTNAGGVCMWKDAVGSTSAGPVRASKGMPDAHVA